MNREAFDTLVQQVEQGVGRDPAALRQRIARLVLTGYAVLLAWVGFFIFLAAVFLVPAFHLGWSQGLVLFIFGGSMLCFASVAIGNVLWVRINPPPGRQVRRVEAPALYAVLDELQTRLRAVPFDQVLVDAQCNASFVQVPRLGVFGWPRRYLVLGLPLLDGLSPEEFRAVLAHEFAHLSRQHGRFGQWIYRLRRSWEQLFEQYARPSVEGEVSWRPFMQKFVAWFWPQFNAHAFVLSRTNEYEADAVAAQLAGAESLASALLRIRLLSHWVDEKFWPDLWQRAHQESAPPEHVLRRLRDDWRADPLAKDGGKWIEQAFRTTTTNADTHPCLTERLRALGHLATGVATGQFPPPPALPPISAAEALLGSVRESLGAEVEANWRQECEPVWRDRHAKANALQHRLTSLQQAVADLALDADSLWDKARVLLELNGERASEPLLRQILTLQPAHVAANFHLGRLLLQDNDATGESFLEHALKANSDLTPAVCELLHTHYHRLGRTDGLRALRTRLDQYEAALAASRVERSTVTAADKLIPHGLSETELVPVRAKLAAEAELIQAELVRKELQHFPEQRLFLLCLHLRPAWHRFPNRDRERALVCRLSQTVQLPGRILIFAPSGSFRSLAQKIRQVPGAALFDASNGLPHAARRLGGKDTK